MISLIGVWVKFVHLPEEMNIQGLRFSVIASKYAFWGLAAYNAFVRFRGSEKIDLLATAVCDSCGVIIYGIALKKLLVD